MLPSEPCSPFPVPTPLKVASKSMSLMPLSFMKPSSRESASPTSPLRSSAGDGSSTSSNAFCTSSMVMSPSPLGSRYLTSFTTSPWVNLVVFSGNFMLAKPFFSSHSVTLPPTPSPKLVSMRSNHSSIGSCKSSKIFFNFRTRFFAVCTNDSTALALLAFLNAASNSLISMVPSPLGSKNFAMQFTSSSLKSSLGVSDASFRVLSASSSFFLSLAFSLSLISILPMVMSAFLMALANSSVSMSPSSSGSRYLMRAAQSSSSSPTSSNHFLISE
mmetsp:Transcript_9348/g.16948  ORF Transcript_9348/g.16948 Transcript_9348/m.16948 type:complete len:273 (-) Transcript_9348:26-844(-)